MTSSLGLGRTYLGWHATEAMRSISPAMNIAVLILFSWWMAFGQTYTGRITGVVTDPSGAAIPGAEVSALNIRTGLTFKVPSDTEGAYRLLAVPLESIALQFGRRDFRKW